MTYTRVRPGINCGSITGSSHPADIELTRLDEQRAINRAILRQQQEDTIPIEEM